LATRVVDSSRGLSIRRSLIAARPSPASTGVIDPPETLMNDLTQHPSHRLPVGLAVITIGALALLDQQHVFNLPLLHTFWPLALVLLGLGRLGLPQRAGGGLGAAALIVVGSVMTAHNLGYGGFSLRDWWPAFVILAGLSMLLRPATGNPGR
jgi:hypothetical protein